MTPVLDPTDIAQFRTVVTTYLGLQYEDGKLDYLADVMRQRLKSVGRARFDSYSAYLGHLQASPKGSAEWRALADELTVNETFFFRNPDNFLALAELVLPERIRAKAQTKQLCILSAGCSSGDEPYSLAIMVREALPDLQDWDLKWLCVLLNEADVMASASSKYGPELGESLAKEWRLIDFPLQASVASLEGRKAFLQQLLFSSPSSLVLGLSERIATEIRSTH